MASSTLSNFCPDLFAQNIPELAGCAYQAHSRSSYYTWQPCHDSRIDICVGLNNLTQRHSLGYFKSYWPSTYISRPSNRHRRACLSYFSLALFICSFHQHLPLYVTRDPLQLPYPFVFSFNTVPAQPLASSLTHATPPGNIQSTPEAARPFVEQTIIPYSARLYRPGQ